MGNTGKFDFKYDILNLGPRGAKNRSQEIVRTGKLGRYNKIIILKL